jgi:hypothetical protein
VTDGRGFISKNLKAQMSSTEQEMPIEVNRLPAEVSDLIRASFISLSDPIDLGDFFIRKRAQVKLHPSVDRKIKSNHMLIPRSTEEIKSVVFTTIPKTQIACQMTGSWWSK